MKNNPKGNAVLVIILIVAIVAIGGWVYHSENKSESNQVTKTSNQTTQTIDWKTYKNEKNGFEFKYPSNYYVVDDTNQIFGDTAHKVSIHILNFEDKNKANRQAFFDLQQGQAEMLIGTQFDNTSKSYRYYMDVYNSAKKNCNFAGLPAVCGTEGPQGNGGAKYISTISAMSTDGNLYKIDYVPTSGDLASTSQQILASFKFGEKSDLSPQEIFNQVSATEGFHMKLNYFRIFGQDKVQYSFGSGTNYEYKLNGVWHAVPHPNSEAVENCSDYASVPEQYRPPCFDASTNKGMYADSNGQSVNYPPSEMISYIGQ